MSPFAALNPGGSALSRGERIAQPRSSCPARAGAVIPSDSASAAAGAPNSQESCLFIEIPLVEFGERDSRCIDRAGAGRQTGAKPEQKMLLPWAEKPEHPAQPDHSARPSRPGDPCPL